MNRRIKKREPDEAKGAPEWMVTFSDCMTLLLTFFVLLLTFSSFDEEVFRQFKIIFAQSLSSVSLEDIPPKDAFVATPSLSYKEEFDKGSEKPTQVTDIENNLKSESSPVNFRNRKVFLISSEKVFYGRGEVMSPDGRKVLSAMASFLKEMPNRIVVSERGKGSEEEGELFGLGRAWAVVQYLTGTQELDKGRFSVSATSMVVTGDTEESSTSSKAGNRRMLEIVLLERSIYN